MLAESVFDELGALLVLAGVALGLMEVLESPPELVSSAGDFSSSCARAGIVRPARDRKRAVKQTKFFLIRVAKVATAGTVSKLYGKSRTRLGGGGRRL